MKETYKETLMLLAGLVIGLACGGLIVYIWQMNSASPVTQTTSNTSVVAASDKTTIQFDEFGFSAKIPSTWHTTRQNFEENDVTTQGDDGVNSTLSVEGPEGNVHFTFNVDGIGGAPCEQVLDPSIDPDVVSVDTPEITTKAGVGTACHVVHKDGTETWAIGMGNFVKSDVKQIKNAQGTTLSLNAAAKGNIANSKQTILDIISSADL